MRPDPYLDELLGRWQKILRLQDWTVAIHWSRQRNLPDGKQGTCGYSLQKKTAVIKIMEPGDYPEDTMSPQDVEQCVVHELIHLHCGQFDEDFSAAQFQAQEVMINMLAAAFVGRPVS